MENADLAREEYEASTGMSPDEYERRLVAAVRDQLNNAHDVLVQSVTLEHQHQNTYAVVRFRVRFGGDRAFGWRMAIWPAPPPTRESVGTPEDAVAAVPVYLAESVFGAPLPDEHDADGVYWLPDWE